MGTLRTRTVGGTVLLALVLVLAGCSGGGVDSTPAATPTPTDAGTTVPGGDGSGADASDGNDRDRVYGFEDGEAYGYEVRVPNGTTRMSWVVTSAADASPGQGSVTVNVSAAQDTASVTASQADVFAAVIGDGAVGEPFLYARTPVVLAAGQDLRVGNSWPIQGSDVTVGDGFEVRWTEATAEITGTATVAGETCYTMELRIAGNGTGPTSCLKADWPFALAVDTPEQDYRLVEFERP